MSKLFVPLGVTKEYCPAWGAWESVREMVQNGMDAEMEKGAPLTVTHKGQMLTITNSGAILPREAMMLGLTTKRENEELIGEHGEGLKVGALAGMRAGLQIRIYTGDEVWEPVIQFYEGYKAETFGFLVKPWKSKGTDQVEIRMQGVSAEDWALWRHRFLNLAGNPRVARVSCAEGDLLNDPAFAGQIYVKGVYVTTRKGMSYGYNFRRLKLDRDRQVLDSHDIWAAAAKIFSAVGTRDKGWAKRIYGLLAHVPKRDEEGENEAEGLQCWHLSEEVKGEVARQFITEHGEGAVAVQDEKEARLAESAGLRPVQVTRSLRDVVAQVHGTVATQRKRMAKEVRAHHDPSTLTPAERDSLSWALRRFGNRITEFAERVEVVDFRLAETDVLSSAPDDQVAYLRVARKALGDPVSLVVAICTALAAQRPGLAEMLLLDALQRERGAAVEGSAEVDAATTPSLFA